jgi:hypothetical protein
MTNTFELSKKLLATLMLVGMMTAFVTGCSSSGDSDDSSSGGSSSEDTQPLSCDENDTEQQCKDQIM